MAVLKHIKSRNANYSDALEYLLFQHDEKSGKVICDDLGRKLLREEYYIDGLNCEPMAFDVECKRTNAIFHKNQNQKDIKSHHYIISFDPKDTEECGLTGQRAHELSMELTRKIFSGYQALVVTHTDGGNHSGNIHTHIVINSVRKYDAPREGYMTQPGDHKAGRKHRSTNKFLEHFKKEVMEMCEREGLHQIDLLSPAPEKVTEAEFRIRARGQKKIEQMNQAIKKEGLTPTATVFQTQKDFLRKAIKECSRGTRSFEEFQDLLLEDYNISVISQRTDTFQISVKARLSGIQNIHIHPHRPTDSSGIIFPDHTAAYKSPWHSGSSSSPIGTWGIDNMAVPVLSLSCTYISCSRLLVSNSSLTYQKGHRREYKVIYKIFKSFL